MSIRVSFSARGFAVGAFLLLLIPVVPAPSAPWEIVRAWLDAEEGPEGDVDPYLWDAGIVLRNRAEKPSYAWSWAVVWDEPDHAYNRIFQLDPGEDPWTPAGGTATLRATIDAYRLVGPMSVSFHVYGADIPAWQPSRVIHETSRYELDRGMWIGSGCYGTPVLPTGANCVHSRRDEIQHEWSTEYDGCMDNTVYTQEQRMPHMEEFDIWPCAPVFSILVDAVFNILKDVPR